MEETVVVVIAIVLAYIVDFLIGDPYGWPHPIVLFGNSIIKGEKLLNRGQHRLLKGAAMSLFLIGFTFVLFYYLNHLAALNVYTLALFVFLFSFWGLANRCLIKECQMVFEVLNDEGLEAGRNRLSYIVGRNTKDLNAQQIRKATLETMSENLSDGVVAPLFYLAIAGVPGMMTYKMINTLDSSIGYKNSRYIDFGKIAAYIDDVVNYIPARITAILMALVSFNFKSAKFILKYGRAHSSPNAGFPESALAGILNCRFGGPSRYEEKIVEKPYIGVNDRKLLHTDLKLSVYVNHAVCLCCVVLTVVNILSGVSLIK